MLVTNALYMLQDVDQIVLLKNGTIEAVGTYDGLLRDSPVFSDLIANYTNSNMDEDIEDNAEVLKQIVEEEISDDSDFMDTTEEMVRNLSLSTSEVSILRDRHNSTLSNGSMRKRRTSSTKDRRMSTVELKDKSKLVQAEHVESGKVGLSVYRKFLNALTFFWSIMIFVNYLLITTASTGSSFWLSSWTSATDAAERSHFYLLIYFAIGMSQAFFVCVGWISVVRGTLGASRKLHWKLLSSIVHAPMHFFDTTPLGRIVNRFSKDIDVLDSTIQLLIR